jgi:hypothetical protein
MNRYSILKFRGRIVSETCRILPNVESSEPENLPRVRIYILLYEFPVMALSLAVHALSF